ncbi:hypothetical protein BDW59DRAFT_178493 [Aspergillus cavernicola]|uniref:Uncharacterized protein n=1 Tax=Aspergillus cavernicola TaxID=176166 RepID=A0ABR4HC48_9EURO
MSAPSDGNNLDVVVVGAGLGGEIQPRASYNLLRINHYVPGICVAVNLQRRYPHVTFAVFERNHRVGGTWAKNTYPGLRCDIPSELYSYSFAPNPNWSSTFASQAEILAYVEDVADQNQLTEFILLQQECLSASWKDDVCMWDVQFRNHITGAEYAVKCRVLITSVGFLDVPRGADDISGIGNFQGAVFHSSSWDHDTDFSGKNVVVLGNGCSANQFIPWLVNSSGIAGLTQIIRSAHWIAPKVDRRVGPKEKWILSHFTWVAKAHRWLLAVKFDLAFAAFRKNRLGRFLRTWLEASLKSYMERIAPVEYHSLLIPTFPFGAKRPVLDHGYLEALKDSRVAVIRPEKVQVAGPHLLTTERGQHIPTDILILANGFKAQSLLTPMEIYGRNVPLFPNLFIVTGPNTLPSGHSTLLGIECTVDYILRVIRPLFSRRQGDQCRHIKVRRVPHDDYNFNLQHRLDGLIYSSDVRNWYVDERTGRNTLVWPGTQFEFWVTRSIWPVRWEDYEFAF